jgi:hypothetical protein
LFTVSGARVAALLAPTLVDLDSDLHDLVPRGLTGT